MATEEFQGSCGFEILFTQNVPHLLEKIFFSLDYESFKTCQEVNKIWHDLLTSDSYLKKAKIMFQEGIVEDEKKLHLAIKEGSTDVATRILDMGLVDVNYQLFKLTPGLTPLLTAVSYGKKDMTKFLLEKGADPNMEGFGGWLQTLFKTLLPATRFVASHSCSDRQSVCVCATSKLDIA